MRLVEREERAAIVQREAGPGRHEAAAEPLVDALNQRDDVAVLVDRREVDGVAAGGVRQAVEHRWLDVRGGPRRIDQSGARCLACALSSIAGTGVVAEPWIADVPQHVGVGQLLRFDHHVQRLGAVESVLAQRKLLHQVEHQQRGDALRVRRQLVDRPASIGRGDRVRPIRARTRCRSAAVIVPPCSLEISRIASADLPVVERRRPFARDEPQAMRRARGS